MEKQIELKLNFRDKRPIAEQLQEEMHRLIQEGVLQPGSQLPTVRTLAAQLRVNFNTVARVYRMLDQEGLISTQRGRGSYILEDVTISQPALPVKREEQVEQLIVALIEKASKMQITPKELRAALSRKIRQHGESTISSRRKRGTVQRKRIVTPAWIREARGANSRSSFSKRHRRTKRAA